MEKLRKILVLKKYTSDPVIINETLQNSEDIEEIVGMIVNKKKSAGFQSECFEKYINDECQYLTFLECPPVEEGLFQCNKCASKRVFTMSKQTRRCDEATTVFARCSNCKNGWVVNS